MIMLMGITVIEKEKEKVIPLWFNIIASISILLTMAYSYADKASDESTWIAGGILAILAVLYLIVYAFLRQDTDTTIYRVTLDSRVSYTELTTKYDILQKEGDIYIIKERKPSFSNL